MAKSVTCAGPKIEIFVPVRGGIEFVVFLANPGKYLLVIRYFILVMSLLLVIENKKMKNDENIILGSYFTYNERCYEL